ACIRCGACVPACPHTAIDVRGDFGRALELVMAGDAVLILSVEAEVHFYPQTPEQTVNACYRAGFCTVYRGVLGDELVAERYRQLWSKGSSGTMIRSTCPVVVESIRREYPALVPYLAPVQTPVQAEAGYIRAKHGADTKIVYVGVCLTEGGASVDAAITLQELEELFRVRRVEVAKEAPFFDRIPEERRRHVSTAGGMPLSVLQNERQASTRFRKMRGMNHLPTIARAVAVDKIDLGFVDLLPCEGCLAHPLMGPADELYHRRKVVQAFEPTRSPEPVIEPEIEVDVGAEFTAVANGHPGVSEEKIEAVIQRIGLATDGTPWDCGACGFGTCRKFASAHIKGRADLRQCPPYQERRAQQAQEEAAVDALTGLATFRVLRDRLRQEVARARRTGVSFAVLFVDMDNFKAVNDRYGHEEGNEVLQLGADAMAKTVRGTDTAARYGGDEFVVLLIGTKLRGARKVGEQIRHAIEEAGTRAGYPEGMVTVSIGAAHFDLDLDDPDVLELADRALYEAKGTGGNRVV
ncbi:MAG: diguanylate cyclase, partial [Gemmatimonadetes bacterium]|nr:diguanylate cyclase [Gemmatimonadota bacterium]